MKIFETIKGEEIPIVPVSDFDIQQEIKRAREEFYQRNEKIERPTYEAELAGGGKETHAHTEESIADDETTPEERVRWDKWQEQQTRLRNELFIRTAKLRLVDGVALEPPEDGAWEVRRRRRGHEIPDKEEDPDEYKYSWICHEIIISNEELFLLVGAIIALNSPIEEAAAVAADMFQRSMEKRGRPEPEGDSGVLEEEGLDDG